MAASHRCLQRAQPLAGLHDARSGITVPLFLAPAWASRAERLRPFSTSGSKRSRVGRLELSTPPTVKFTFNEPPPRPKDRVRVSASELAGSVVVEGPLGKLSVPTPPFVSISSDAATGLHTVRIQDENDGHQRAMWGTIRALIQNQINGVSEGHSCILRLVGVGFRATIEDKAETVKAQYPGQKFVSLKVGYSHPIELPIPDGITASTPQPTRILLEGTEKDKLKYFAARIREWRRPEPYKGKGIFIDDETIRLKAKKIK